MVVNPLAQTVQRPYEQSVAWEQFSTLAPRHSKTEPAVATTSILLQLSKCRPPLRRVLYCCKQASPFTGLLTALFAAPGTAWWVAVLAALVLLAVVALWTGTRARDADVLATFLVVRALGGRHADSSTLPGGCRARKQTVLTSAARQRAARVKGCCLCAGASDHERQGDTSAFDAKADRSCCHSRISWCTEMLMNRVRAHEASTQWS